MLWTSGHFTRSEPRRVTLGPVPLPSQKPAEKTSIVTGRPTLQTNARAVALPPTVTRRSLQRLMTHVSDLPEALIERLWSDADGALGAAAMLKDGDRCTVTRVEQSAEPYTLKRYNLKSTLHTAIHLPLRSRARWSWLNGRKLVKAGLPTPMPLACIEERRHGLLHLRSYLLTQFVPGRSLLDLVQSDETKGERLADLARQFTRIWQTLGQLRAGHGDMKATNFIVDPQGKLWLIDLDGLRIHHSAVLLRRERRNDLARFMQNWQEKPEVAAVFRARIGTG